VLAQHGQAEQEFFDRVWYERHLVFRAKYETQTSGSPANDSGEVAASPQPNPTPPIKKISCGEHLGQKILRCHALKAVGSAPTGSRYPELS